MSLRQFCFGTYVYQLLQCLHIPAIVAWLVYRGFGDEGSMGQPQVIQQDAKGFFANGSLPDVLVAIQFRAAGGFGVIAVPDFDIVQADGGVEMRQRLVEAFFADDVVSGNVGVAGIDARGNGGDTAEAGEDLGDLPKAGPE